MRLTSQIFFSFFFIFSFFACEALPDIQKIGIHRLELKDCLLPKDHPLQARLKGFFKDPKMFKSNEHWRKAGFITYNKPYKSFMVASHPAIKNYLFKKYNTNTSRKRQLTNYLNRISSARALRQFIQLNNLQHITVPQKWLYPLPKNFDDSKTGKRSYILIVERMDLCSGADDPNGEVGRKYHNMDLDILKELCIVLYHFRGLDSSLRNMPFTRQNKIVFIDTEHWWDKERDFLRHVKRYLTPDRLEYGLAIYEELRNRDCK